MVPDGQLTYEIKEHQDPALDLVPVNLLGHLSGPIGVSSELKTGVRPLVAGLNPLECEVCRHNDFVKPSMIYQP